MAKATSSGASDRSGPVQRTVRYGGIDVDIAGATSDIDLGGNLTVRGNLSVAGTSTLPFGFTAEVDSDEFTSNQSGVAITVITMTAIPLQIVVGDYDVPTYVFGQGYGSHGSSNIPISIGLVPDGLGAITDAVLTTPNFFGATGTNWGWTLQGRLPPHSPGTYNVAVSGNTGTFTPIATEYVPSQVWAFRPLLVEE